MSTIHPPKKQRVKLNADTRVSGYDQTSAFLVAGVTVIGMLVFILFMIWLTLFAGKTERKRTPPIVELAGNDSRPEGVADDWQPPGVEQFPEVTEPQLADALEAVTDAVSTVRASLEKVDGDALQQGAGSGLGDRRAGGPGTGNANIIPEGDRWKIEYTAGNSAEYMSILEFFGIYIGSVNQLSNQIEFFRDLTNTRPSRTVGNRESPEANVLYFINTKTRLKRWDQNKVVAGGGDLKNKLVVQFFPSDLRQRLLELEQAEYLAEGRELTEVRQTRFKCEPSGSGYAFSVVDIQWRPKPNKP